MWEDVFSRDGLIVVLRAAAAKQCVEPQQDGGPGSRVVCFVDHAVELRVDVVLLGRSELEWGFLSEDVIAFDDCAGELREAVNSVVDARFLNQERLGMRDALICIG